MTDVLSRLLAMSSEQRATLVAGLHGDAPPSEATADTQPDLTAWSGRCGPELASFGQEQLWVLDQLLPGSARYNVPFAFDITGWVDDEALHWAVHELARRHPALRTSLSLVDDELVQIVHDQESGIVTTQDVSREAKPVAAARAVAKSLAAQPFNLVEGPLWRASVIRVGPEHRLLVWIASHAVADGWSIGVVASELSAGYTARVRRSTQGGPQPVPFTEFSLWQRRRVGHWHTDFAFWADRLANRTPVVIAPGRSPTGSGATVLRRVPDEIVTGVAALARAQATTPFTVWLAANHLMLAGLTGRDDVSGGTVVAGRPPQFEGTVGSFVNTVVVAADAEPDRSAAGFVGAVRDALLSALEHAEAPFSKVVEALAPGREGSANPLCRTVFTFGSTPGVTHSSFLGSALLEPFGISNGTARFDAELAVEPLRGMTRLRLEYDTGVLSAPEAERLCGAYLAVLATLTRDHPTVAECRAVVGQVLDLAVDTGNAATQANDIATLPAADVATLEAVIAVWSQFLPGKAIDPDDEFFGLGGHSMMATRIVAALRAQYGVQLDLVELFEYPTAAGLAAVIDQRRKDSLTSYIANMTDEQVAGELARLGASA